MSAVIFAWIDMLQLPFFLYQSWQIVIEMGTPLCEADDDDDPGGGTRVGWVAARTATP